MGQYWSLLDQYFPPKSNWSVDQIPDLTGRVVVVTGGNTGIGKETVKALLTHNAKVYLAARSRRKAEEAINDLEKQTGKSAIFLELDLASKAKIRKAAAEFLNKEKELHILFDNGGVMWPDHKELTTDGYDLQWGTNVVGHYLFTSLLLPALEAATHTSPDGKARVVVTSSSAAYLYTINWETFVPGPGRDKMSSFDLYSQSKFANVVFARELGRRYGAKNIVVTAVNPGNIRTDLQRNVSSIGRYILNLMLYPAPYGAITQLWAGTSSETADLNGKYLIPWARVGECRPEANDPELGQKLWEYFEQETKA
ncbi:NAD(P)-binding protein [Auriscalpium vulgare]|uniref:NAD(P)-binding protein n=1 Tax=Auriscalpium vulgare TaxID=40419 RepID=A0ACB8SBW3_9AGAM|nr:NAD(P)-binding protein [Auriscalpium vulgare]